MNGFWGRRGAPGFVKAKLGSRLGLKGTTLNKVT